MFKQPGKQIPIYIGHASGDPTVPWVTQELFFKNIKTGAPDYPVRFELFKGPDAVARHADPHDGLARRAQLDARGERSGELSPRSGQRNPAEMG